MGRRVYLQERRTRARPREPGVELRGRGRHSALAALEKFPSLQKLDYRLAASREFAAGWFSSGHLATEKAREIEMLGKTEGWGPTNRLIDSNAPPKPIAGTPGSAGQARARLALLEEISPHCPDPLLQEKIAASRAALQRQAQARGD